MLHSECFYRCNMAVLKADVSFYGLDIYISSFYLGRFVLFFRWLSLFICSVIFPYLVFFAVVGVLLLGIPIKRYVITELNLLRKELHPYMTVDQGVYMISFDRLFLKKEVAYFEM